MLDLFFELEEALIASRVELVLVDCGFDRTARLGEMRAVVEAALGCEGLDVGERFTETFFAPFSLRTRSSLGRLKAIVCTDLLVSPEV